MRKAESATRSLARARERVSARRHRGRKKKIRKKHPQLARARELRRASEWDLERLDSANYGPKQEVTISPKLKETLGLDDQSLAALNRPLAVVELEASKSHNKAMHDLNALALSGFLALHVAHVDDQIVDPPFFPIAGIAFGQQVATQILANLLAARENNHLVKSVSYLYETAESILSPFWSKELQSKKRTTSPFSSP